MKVTTYIQASADLPDCHSHSLVSDVLIEPQLTARQGKLSAVAANALAYEAAAQNLRTVLGWDILMSQEVFEKTVHEIKEIDFELFDAVRVYDLGAAQWVMENRSDLALELIAENRCHNLEALKGWEEYFQKAHHPLTKIILSLQLPRDKVCVYAEALDTPVETLGAGRVEMFYSPRPLLQRQVEQRGGLGEVEVAAHPEGGEGDFPAVQTNHGTLLFYHQDYCGLEYLQEYESAGVDSLRLDFRHIGDDGRATDGMDEVLNLLAAGDGTGASQAWPTSWDSAFPTQLRTPRNRSRVFSKEKNARCLAKVISIEEGKNAILQTFQAAHFPETVQLVTTSGEEHELSQLACTNFAGEQITAFEEDEILLAPWDERFAPEALLFAPNAPA